jgi:O-antigen ligase
MQDYWWRGVGLGSDILTKTFKSYPPMFDGNFPIHTHNNYLQMWAETGILGALSFLATLLYQLKAGIKAYQVSTDQRLKNMLAAALAGFCGILLISVAEYTWYYARNMFLYFFLFGFIAACIKLARQSARAQA